MATGPVPQPKKGAIPRPHSKVPEIQEIDDFTESINILCHADSGAGKTVLWSGLDNMLILAIEEGTVSAKRRGSNAKVMRIKTWPDLVAAFEWFRDGGSMVVGGKTWNAEDFEWILIDSVTAAQIMCLRYIMEQVVKANPARDPHIPAQGDHFKWQLWMKEMIQDFNSLDQNIIWTARSMVKEDPDGETITVPLIEGKDYAISAWVVGEMHMYCHLKKERKGKGDTAKIVRRLYTNDHPTYWCKDRYDVLPHVIEFDDPDGVAKKIVDIIKSSNGQTVAKKTPPKKKTAPRKKVTRNG